MPHSTFFFNRTFSILAAALGLFFLARGIWVGIEGMNGIISLDQRDWTGIVLFVLIGVGLLYFVWDKSRRRTK